MCGGTTLRLAMLMAGPEPDPETKEWFDVAAWIKFNLVRVIVSKTRMNEKHPLIEALRMVRVSFSMLAFEPYQDGLFVVYVLFGEAYKKPEKAEKGKLRSCFPAPQVHKFELREHVDHTNTCVFYLCTTSSNSIDEEDGFEAEEWFENKRPRTLLSDMQID